MSRIYLHFGSNIRHVMKKIAFVLILLLTAGWLPAQIVLNQSDMAQPGDVIIQSFQSIAGTPPSTGAAQTWVFNGSDTTALDTVLYLNPAQTPYADSVPGSNLALVSGGAYTYYNKTAAGFYLRGLVFPLSSDLLPIDVPFTALPLRINPQLPVFTFPATFGSNQISTGTSRFEFPFDTVIQYLGFPVTVNRAAILATINDTSLINGYGEGQFAGASLPLLRNEQKMKISVRIQVRINTFLGPTWIALPDALLPPGGLPEFRFRTILFWANNQKAPVASFDLDSSGSVSGAAYRKDLLITGNRTLLNTRSSFGFSLWPNPAEGMVQTQSDTPLSYLEIFSPAGKKLRHIPAPGAGIPWNTEGLAEGLYWVRGWNEKGETAWKSLIVR